MNTAHQATTTPLQIPDLPHTKVIYFYGLFMVAWSVLEAVIQAAIMKKLKIGADDAVILTGKLQFNPRIQLLCALLRREGDTHREATKLLNKTEAFAHRNTMVHGNIITGIPSQLTFVKYDGGASAKQTFTAEGMASLIDALNARTARLQDLLQVTDADMQLIGDATLSMAT